ncbi:MAG: hypothetical protein J6T05_07200 [Prevotella sp.]|nr:hypothetical protein [Prevotella sp.]
MKKIYISPKTECIKIGTIGMIATSSQSLGGASDYSGGGTISGAREFSDWDDDF